MEKQLLRGFLFLVLMVSHAFAQNKVITGTVTGKEDGLPIVGATVKVKGTKTGIVTSIDGKYSIPTRSSADVLVFSYLGYATKEITVGTKSLIDVELEQTKNELNEVVVTAFGQKREKKALGYAVSTVDSKDIAQRPESDIARVLNGKAPGVSVVGTSGLSGSGTNIVIRAVGTITGGSSPLFIVDGVPFDGGTNNKNADFTFGTTTSSRFLDLDPNNIESVNVLKGLSATTLYGEKGVNGVVVVTTKNGSTNTVKPKTEITVSQSYFATQAILPEYNTAYGGGFDLSLGLAFFSNWGAKFTNPAAIVKNPWSKPYFPQDTANGGINYQYKYYNSVHNFFRTGFSENTSVNVAGSAKAINYNTSYSHTNENGYLIGNTLSKDNLGVGGTAKLSNRFTISATLNYVSTNAASPPTSNSTGNNATFASVFGNVLYTPTAVDLMGQPYENPLDHSSFYYRSGNDIQNPRWTLYNSFTNDNVNRLFGQVSLKFDFSKSLNLLYHYGVDYYNESQLYAQNKGGTVFQTGILSTTSADNKTIDQTLSLNFNKRLSDQFNLDMQAGVNDNDVKYSQQGLTSTTQLVYGLLTHGNFVSHSPYSINSLSTPAVYIPLNYTQETRNEGVFAQGTLGFKDYLYLTAGARNSWTSTVEEVNRSILYPGVSISFIPTEAISALKNNKEINYLKFRLGYSTSARFPDPYSTRQSLDIKPQIFVTSGGQNINSNSFTNLLANPDLKPELSKELEVGTEGKFLDNRLSIDLTFYRRVTDNEILYQALDPSTGFGSRQINAGTVTNRGIEAAAGYTIVRNKDWRWQLDGQFTLNRNLVTNLPSSIDHVEISGYSNQGTIAKNGSPLGVIYGSYIIKDAAGNKEIDVNGNYLTASGDQVIGDPNPKWKTTGINTLSYKNFSFRMQWEYTYGGDIYSGTVGALLGRGVTKDTQFDRAEPLILPGVLASSVTTANPVGIPNNIQISATQAYYGNSVTNGAADETAIYDATVLRLRELSLSYALPSKLFAHTPIGSASISISGSNLWYYAPNIPKYTHFDPESDGLGVGNGRGMEFLSGPSARRFGGSIKLTF